MRQPHPTRDRFSFWTEVEVRWGDMDAMGHVNNTVYFTYMESARIDFLGRLGRVQVRGRAGGAQQGPTLVATACDFVRQVVFPTTLDIGLAVEAIGRSSFRIRYGMFRKETDELMATGQSTNAWLDYATNRSIDLPTELRAALEVHLVA